MGLAQFYRAYALYIRGADWMASNDSRNGNFIQISRAFNEMRMPSYLKAERCGISHSDLRIVLGIGQFWAVQIFLSYLN